jgi:hypothetical protein
VKAKEYVKMWHGWQENLPTLGEIYANAPDEEKDKSADDLDLISFLGQKVLSEYHVIADARKAQTPEALGAIVRELDQKWRAICNRVDSIPPEFFQTLIKVAIEDVKGRQ